jgi:hypothetical protein
MKIIMQVLAFFLILVTLAGLSFAKKPFGEVADPGALLKVQSYCVDMAKIETSAISDVKKFLDKQNTPKGVLGKLPWKLVDNCAQADALVSLNFENSVKVAPAGGSALGTGTAALNSVPEPTYTATMVVTERTSQKPLYKVVGESVTGNRVRSINSPFSKLIHDLKTIAQ